MEKLFVILYKKSWQKTQQTTILSIGLTLK